MWVTKEVADYVPRNCINHFEDICDKEVSAYDHDICEDDDESKKRKRSLVYSQKNVL